MLVLTVEIFNVVELNHVFTPRKAVFLSAAVVVAKARGNSDVWRYADDVRAFACD
jgi:hypothetical protein